MRVTLLGGTGKIGHAFLAGQLTDDTYPWAAPAISD
jgi:uncharacterized protein YbjT (DUF2867 family)